MSVTYVTVLSHDLLVWSHCTVVMGGAVSSWGPLNGRPSFLWLTTVMR